ncbi:glycine betaine transporter OpuD [Gottschalkia purinilytica]|uniref:Glycine betaine transporter OpuD n=1 Tax=Gottschalkia purinilytica TaxID=1503 RepID=A0A0L0W656_GOTPU|nr:BCCT family transporter [Gottschalkia purinilytica]KNF06999.1 glycine betaine transporter OpuD [Gottschalkia purinilytica]
MLDIKRKNNKVFYISLIITFAIVLWGILASENFATFSNSLYSFLTSNFSWLYLIVMFAFVIFAIALAFSKYGNIKLGSDNSTPEYSTISWFGMLFGAGMGIGLVFWGVAEPISHFVNPSNINPGSIEASNFAIKSSFMHWGIHPWASYSIIGLALAYFQFRKNKPGLISSIFIPLIGEEKVNGPIGKLIDILAVFATIAGVATSLGLGTLQINSGLNYVFNIPQTKLIQIIIISIITIIFIWTAVSGINKGIKLLGDINLVLALLLLGSVIVIGPTLKIINSFTNGLGQYLSSFIRDSLHIEAFGDNSWINKWTIFYWAWWIAWAPFVGTFIARISKGRTIREFIGGVILAPALASCIWFAAFGSLGLNLKNTLGIKGFELITKAPETTLFGVLEHYPIGGILSVVTIILLCTFFVTSANSATFVLGMLTSNGNLNPSNKKKILWGLIQSLLAVSLLFSGGLEALQTASVAAAFPFIFVMIFAMVSLTKALKSEKL